MCSHRRTTRARNVLARIKRQADDKVFLVGGMRAQADGSMTPNPRAPEPKGFREITYCSERGCRLVHSFTPETARA